MTDKLTELEERIKKLEREARYQRNKDNPMEDVGDWRVVVGDNYDD